MPIKQIKFQLSNSLDSLFSRADKYAKNHENQICVCVRTLEPMYLTVFISIQNVVLIVLIMKHLSISDWCLQVRPN